jgi:hypothetical protein
MVFRLFSIFVIIRFSRLSDSNGGSLNDGRFGFYPNFAAEGNSPMI